MGLLNPCFVSRGWFLYTMIVPGEWFLFASSRVPGGGMVMDEIDTCIKFCDKFCSPYPIVRIFNHQNRELYFLENLESLFK